MTNGRSPDARASSEEPTSSELSVEILKTSSISLETAT